MSPTTSAAIDLACSPHRLLVVASFLAVPASQASAEFIVPSHTWLAMQQVQEETGRNVVLELTSGTRLEGRLVGETDELYLLNHPQLGPLSVPRSQVAQVLEPGVDLGPIVDEEPPEDSPPPPPGVLGTGFLAGWEKSLTIGLTGKSGNVDEIDLYSKFAGDFSNEDLRWRVRAAYFYGLAENEPTKNEGYANARRDWMVPDAATFLWAEGRLDYNEFKEWIFRTGGFLGVGYNVYDEDAFKLLGRIGAGASYEFGEVNEAVPEALLSVEADWQLAENQRVEFLNTVFPDLDDVGEFRNFTEATYTIDIDRARGLSLKVGLQNEYNSLTIDDSEHNDLTYFGALVLSF